MMGNQVMYLHFQHIRHLATICGIPKLVNMIVQLLHQHCIQFVNKQLKIVWGCLDSILVPIHYCKRLQSFLYIISHQWIINGHLPNVMKILCLYLYPTTTPYLSIPRQHPHDDCTRSQQLKYSCNLEHSLHHPHNQFFQTQQFHLIPPHKIQSLPSLLH